MSLSSQVLLSAAARERCIANLKELPTLISKDIKGKKTASVLVPLCVNHGEVCLLYTLRSTNLKNHSGQISFPGGKTDENERAVDTALRETEEEIGVSRSNVEVWGEMPQFQGRRKDIVITPIVGFIKNFDSLTLERSVNEVEEIFTVPMKSFCDANNHAHYQYEAMPLPIFLHGKYTIWGITGWITHLFLQSFLPNNVYKVDFMRKRFEYHELMPSSKV